MWKKPVEEGETKYREQSGGSMPIHMREARSLCPDIIGRMEERQYLWASLEGGVSIGGYEIGGKNLKL